jgi:tetratricopeptide (TPR) repeat protein
MKALVSSPLTAMNHFLQRKQKLIVAMLLILATLLVYAPVRDHQFLHFDDDKYVTNDFRIQQGVTWDNLLWGLTAIEEGLWKPVTLYSHMLDVQLFGLNPAGHLLVNLLFHVLNVLLLFWVLHQATGAVWPSALVAALFALHPLSVESVAWVAERKNVLSTLFWLVTMGAYVGYVRQPSRLRYMGVMGALVLGLMTKPMLVTLPFVLLLMDYWPLGRLSAEWVEFRKRLPSLVVEKLPFFVPVVAVSAVTIYGAGAAQGLQSLQEISFGTRLGNALLGYGLYLKKMVWPMDLAAIYPLSGSTPSTWPVVLAAMVLVVITVGVWRRRERSRYLVVGWCWFLGTLVPVNGLLQSGYQAMADRYAYVPMIGIFIMLSWGAVECLRDRGWERKWLAGAVGCVMLALAIVTRVQLSYWQDTTTLFERALRVTSDNYMAHYAMATGLYENGDLKEAVHHLKESVEINPRYFPTQALLGMVLAEEGSFDEAEETLSEALRLGPRFAEPNNGMGFLRVKQGRLGEAVEYFSRALAIEPEMIEAQRNLAGVLGQQGKADEAIELYRRVIQLAPNDVVSHYFLAVHLMRRGEVDEPIHHFTEAVKYNPDLAEAHNYLGFLRIKQGRVEEAPEHLLRALEIDPEMIEAQRNLGNVLNQQGKADEAIESYRRVLELAPNDAMTHNNLGAVLLQKGEIDEAVRHFSEALKIDPNYRTAQGNLDRVQSR